MTDCISHRNAFHLLCVRVFFLVVSWMCFSCIASAQSQMFGSQTPPPLNEPSVVHQPVVRIQPSAVQNSNTLPPSIQPYGQRVFASVPNSNAVPFSPGPATHGTISSDVQQASWESTSTLQSPINSKARAPLELKPSSKGATGDLDKPKSSWSAALSMFFSLAVVLSFFLLVAWLVKKSQPNSFLKLPGEVVQVMGRSPMAPRQQMYVVRFGSKLLLISHQPGQTQTLCEISNSDEVQRLAGLCEANHPGSISNSFRDVLKQVTSGKLEPETKARGGLTRRAS